MRVSIYFLAVLLTLFAPPVHTASISALEDSAPFRNGKIFPVFPFMTTTNGTVTIVLDTALPGSPVGVAIGIRTLQLNNASCHYSDYSLAVITSTASSFQIAITISSTYAVSYNKIAADYFTNSNAGALFVYTSFSGISNCQLTTAVGESLVWTWTFSQWGVTSAVESQLKVALMPFQMVGSFPSSNLTMAVSLSFDNTNQIKVMLKMSNDTILNRLDVSSIVYINGMVSIDTTKYAIGSIHMANSLAYSLLSLELLSSPNLVIGLSGIKGGAPATKLQFSFGYTTESPQNTSYQYQQQHPQLNLIQSQNSGVLLTYLAEMFWITRINCSDNTYPYLNYRAQRCFTQCPATQYTDAPNYRCLLCSSCTQISACGECYSTGCDNYHFFNASVLPFVCTSCTTLANCSKCFSNSSGVYCSQCLSGSNVQLIQGICQPCSPSTYLDTVYSVCVACTNTLSSCKSCSDSVTCLQCEPISKTQLISNQCVPCNSTSYYNSSGYTCQLCSLVLSDCESCTDNAANCLSCTVSSQKQLVLGLCQPCNSSSYYQPASRTCRLCSLDISDCATCTFSSTIQCISCDPSSTTQLVNNACQLIICNSTSYFNSSAHTCLSCQSFTPNCVSCSQAQGCLACDDSYELLIADRSCDPCSTSSYYNQTERTCNLCSSQIQSCQECFWNSSLLLQCTEMQPSTCDDDCNATMIPSYAIEALTSVVSIPTLSLLTRSLVSIVGLFDDLSYYSYHNRNYSKVITPYLLQMTNFTLSRFVMGQLEPFLNAFLNPNLTASLGDDIQRSPGTFQKYDGNVYFTTNTQKMWLNTLPLSLLIFGLMSLLYWVTNKFFPNNFLRKYDYMGMVIVDLMGCNVQFLSFNCFEQMYQQVPIGKYYYLNLIFCYMVLSMVITFCLFSPYLFRTVYPQVQSKYMMEELFGETRMTWFMISNLLKMFTGFVHAFFFYEPMVQSMLLGVTYVAKVALFSQTINYGVQKFEYSFSLVGYSLFAVLQLLFCVEVVLLQDGEYGQQLENSMGAIEVSIVLLMIIGEVLAIVVLTIKKIIEVTGLIKPTAVQKSLIADIKITKRVKERLQKKSTRPLKNILRKQQITQVNNEAVMTENQPMPQRSLKKAVGFCISHSNTIQKRGKPHKSAQWPHLHQTSSFEQIQTNADIVVKNLPRAIQVMKERVVRSERRPFSKEPRIL